MQAHKFDEYTVTLENTGKKGEYGKARVAYSLTDPNGKVLFQADDLFCSPMHKPESYESAVALLSFLTIQPGDVEEEFFKNYTPEQIAFRDSMDCQNLQLYTLEDDEYGYAEQKNFD